MIHADIVGERARLSADRTALVEVATGRRLSYRQLDQRARACALMWSTRLGLAPGDRIGILAGNRLEMLDNFFAAGKTGVVLVPLGTRLTAGELAEIVNDAGLSALIYDGEHAATAGQLRTLVDIDRWVAIDEPLDDDLSYDAAVAGASESAWPWQRPAPQDPYCLLYTSGTTGKPKGVITPHRMVAFNAYNTVLNWQLSEDDVSPIFTPLYHAGGLGAFLTPILVAGGTIVLHAAFDAEEVWRVINEERCTVVLGVPTIWKILADAPAFETARFDHVRWFISGGAPLPRHLIDTYRQRGVVLRQGYGLTEVGVNCFAMDNDEAWQKAGSIGRPLMFTEAMVIDRDGRQAPPDEVGELVFRGPHVSAGYWKNPQATAAALDSDGWFHTGDMARVDSDGFFTIAGRAKDMFISGGVNIYPAEIEGRLLQHPDLADAAVIGVPHDTWGEVGVAYVVPVEGHELAAAELAAFIEQSIAKFKVPKHFVMVAELPRTAYGKVVKGELRKLWNSKN